MTFETSEIVCALAAGLGFFIGFHVGAWFNRKRQAPVITSLEQNYDTALRHVGHANKERSILQCIADDRNVAIGRMGQDIERLKLREAEARKILEPLAECDPAVREWLGK